MQDSPFCADTRPFDFCTDILGDGSNVFHYPNGIFEHIGVYSLQNIVLDFPVAVEVYLICRIDMSERQNFARAIFSPNLKNTTYFFNVLFIYFCHYCFSPLDCKFLTYYSYAMETTNRYVYPLHTRLSIL